LSRLVTVLDNYRRDLAWWLLPILMLVAVGVAVLVYQTGGIKYVFAHSMYVPIVLGGLLFGVAGGLALALAGGLALGPFMPIDVTTGEMQQTINWLYRAGFFCLIGVLAGGASDTVRWYMGRLRWTLRHDLATGLPNRTALLELLEQGLGDEVSSDGLPTLAMLSLENADELTVAFGADASDAVIRELARRLEQSHERHLSVFRMNRSRLCVLASMSNREEGGRWLEHLNEQVVEPYNLEQVHVHADFRLGLAWLDKTEISAQEMLKKAEAALVAARNRGSNLVVDIGEAESASRANIELLGQLRHALHQGHLEMHYQPKIRLTDGQVVGVEALMRWHHPDAGMIPPGRFIPRAEQSTLIDELTEFAIGRSLDQLSVWREGGLDLVMAVNISARNLANPGFAQMVRDQLAVHRMDGHNLELEVTEGALMHDINRVAELLHGLAGLQVILSIDDFGTGYSSLQYMNDLPVSIIKIDQSFVRRLPGDDGSAHIVAATTDLTHRLNMEVVAEGVENAASLNFLSSLGCDLVQGYHIARPMSAEEFGRWYREVNGRFRVRGAA
jgi:diguanylate cyclase